jgi:uncharacterized protein (TIGR02217 family)
MGAQRRPGWRTNVVETTGGHERTDQQWSKARHRYDVSFAVRTTVDYEAVQDHFHVMRGRAKVFPFLDAVDYKVSASNGVLLDDGDSPTTAYSLGKRYGTGAEAYYRNIKRPRSGTVAIYRLRGVTTTDITSSATISYTTGFVTFTGGTVIGGDVLSWAGQFWVPCRYNTDELPTLIVDRHPSGELLVRCDSIPIVEWRE